MSKVSVKTKNSKNKIVVMQSVIVAGFAAYMLLSTEILLQRNAEKHQAGGLEIVRIQ
jgi:hypothetical protein